MGTVHFCRYLFNYAIREIHENLTHVKNAKNACFTVLLVFSVLNFVVLVLDSYCHVVLLLQVLCLCHLLL